MQNCSYATGIHIQKAVAAILKLAVFLQMLSYFLLVRVQSQVIQQLLAFFNDLGLQRLEQLKIFFTCLNKVV